MSQKSELDELQNRLKQREAELLVINSVQQALSAQIDLQAIYDLVGDKIRDIFDAQVVVIATFDHDANKELFKYAFEAGKKFNSQPRPIDKIRQRLIKTKKLIHISENASEAYTTITGEPPKSIPGTQFPKSMLYVPLIIGEVVLGYVSLQNLDKEHAFSESDVRLVTTLTNSMSVAIENARLFSETSRLLQETNQRATELDTVNRISNALVSQLEFDVLINMVGELMRETFHADIVFLALHDKSDNMIHFPYYYGDVAQSRPFGNGITEKILTGRQPVLINDDLDTAYKKMKAEKRGKWVASFLGVPIVVGAQSIGVISVQRTEEGDVFDAADQRLLSTIAANVGVAIQNADSYKKLSTALEDLKAVQEQLIQQEKLASLGQLTAGIAHEIKNPLNFVNNFSSVSIEMLEEVEVELLKIKNDPTQATSESLEEALTILGDIKANLVKINDHGSRADGIVKSMLMHSRGGSGKKEPADFNSVVKEYVNLAYHGMRASKQPIQVDITLNADEKITEVPIITEDFSRVILNICNNAFDAMRDKVEFEGQKYRPSLTVSTIKRNGGVCLEIHDNGPGIPDDLVDKILQPFFTTKKGTQGTGLGLSITHDIIKAHGGSMSIESTSGKTVFKINLPEN